nr:HAD family hydrolase [Acetobacter conturbans]
MAPTESVRLVVTDMDGTLLTPEKQVTRRSVDTIEKLNAAGVAVCLVSSRAVVGVERYHEALHLTTPYAAMNGALVRDAQGKVLSSLVLPPDAVRATLDMLDVHEVDAWLFCGTDWIVKDATSGYVPYEHKTLGIAPTVAKDFGPWEGQVGKITGSSADYDLLERMEGEISQMLEGRASVARSAQYYLDVTPKDANKGYALRELGRLLGVAPHEIACLGDMPNDVPMLDIAGLSIAMGNASGEVASHAHFVTDTNENEGWAKAIETWVMPRVSPKAG